VTRQTYPSLPDANEIGEHWPVLER